MEEEKLAPEEKRPTAAELKAQIEEKQRELKENPSAIEMPAAPEPAPLAPASSAEPVNQDKPTDIAPVSNAEVAPSQDDKASEAETYAKKKGWKDYEALIDSYRNLEKKLGERTPPPVAPQAPAYQPMPPQYPGTVPFAAPLSPQVINQIARLYPQIAPEDIERIAPFITDLSETIAEKKFRALEMRMVNSERQRQREREIDLLKQDAAFQNEEVRGELSQILEREPRYLETDNGLTIAFNQALATVGRKRLEGSANPQAPRSDKPSHPITPPTTARGTGPANTSRPGISSPNQLTPANFSGLPLDEKRRALRAIGALRDTD